MPTPDVSDLIVENPETPAKPVYRPGKRVILPRAHVPGNVDEPVIHSPVVTDLDDAGRPMDNDPRDRGGRIRRGLDKFRSIRARRKGVQV